MSCGERWWYIYCPLTNTPCSTATPECVTLQQIHTAISVPFRSWCHNPNAGVNTHWCCYQHFRSHSMHCSSSRSTLTASCHIGWTYCSPAESPIISVKRKTCFIMLYQLVCHCAWTVCSKVLRQDTALITDKQTGELRQQHKWDFMNTELVLWLCNRTNAAAYYESEVLTAVWLKICFFWEVKLQYRVAVPDVPKNTVPSKHCNILTKWCSVTSQETWIFSYWYPAYSKLCSIHQLAATGDTRACKYSVQGPKTVWY